MCPVIQYQLNQIPCVPNKFHFTREKFSLKHWIQNSFMNWIKVKFNQIWWMHFRVCSLRKRDGIPPAALRCFNRCLCKRTAYQVPEDALEECTAFQMCGTWEELTEVLNSERGNLCFQVSFDKNVILFGVNLEICGLEL